MKKIVLAIGLLFTLSANAQTNTNTPADDRAKAFKIQDAGGAMFVASGLLLAAGAGFHQTGDAKTGRVLFYCAGAALVGGGVTIMQANNYILKSTGAGLSLNVKF